MGCYAGVEVSEAGGGGGGGAEAAQEGGGKDGLVWMVGGGWGKSKFTRPESADNRTTTVSS